MKESNDLKLTSLWSLGVDSENSNRLMPTVGDNDETAILVNTHATTRIHSSTKGRWHRPDGLNQGER